MTMEVTTMHGGIRLPRNAGHVRQISFVIWFSASRKHSKVDP